VKVLALMAHPDDIEFSCAGTLALLKQAGWEIHLATMTPGDVGSMSLAAEEISRVRRAEAAASAAILGAGYACLESRDLAVFYEPDAKRRATALIREIRPDLVITHAREDYMADHEETSKIAREAVFASSVPNWKTGRDPEPRPCDRIAEVLYADPLGGEDWRGRRVKVRQVVDITAVMDLKERMLAAHESQRSWLRAQHGVDEYIDSMKRWAERRAKDFGRKSVRWAEGFNRHLGHGFPGTDILTGALGGKLVKTLR